MFAWSFTLINFVVEVITMCVNYYSSTYMVFVDQDEIQFAVIRNAVANPFIQDHRFGQMTISYIR